MKSDHVNKDLCQKCDACCRYIATEIDKPTTKDEVENIHWFLLHQNIGVYIGHDNKWYLEFKTPCRKLKNKLCAHYQDRPKICRDYDQKNCPQYNEGETEKIYFHNEEEFVSYVKIKLPKKLWITIVA